MFRVSLDNVSAQRTCQPLHERHQATPYAPFLDAAETHDVYSGMVARRSGEDTVVLADGAVGAQRPLGLFAMDRNAVINDMEGLGSNVPFSVWIGGSDAFFEIDSPAFDDTQSYVVPTNGSRALLYAGTGAALGKLTPTDPGGGRAVAELWEVVSDTKIIVRLLPPGVTVA